MMTDKVLLDANTYVKTSDKNCINIRLCSNILNGSINIFKKNKKN